MPTEKMSKFDYVRLCLGGALFGTVVAGILSSLLGVDPTHPRELGCVVGAVFSAVGFKLSGMA